MKSTAHPSAKLNSTISATTHPRPVFKPGLDVDLHCVVTAIQCNHHVRVLLVEAVWRLLRWQPGWHARLKYLQRLKHGASLKKKMAVALARQLAIDLWRWRTGRATAAELGWVLRSATQEAEK